MKRLLIIILSIISLSSCTDDIIIDTQEGPELVGINGYITNEFKKHQIVLSKTADFYSKEDIVMISDAEVFVYDGYDTIYFKETENKGYYETIEPVAGIIGHTYNLSVCIFDEEGQQRYHAQSTMKENTPQIDSLVIKDFALGGMPFNAKGLYAYFQSSEDPTTCYLINIAVNDSLLNESILDCPAYSLAGASGLYVNGPEFIELFGELPLHIFSEMYVASEDGSFIKTSSIKEGDTVSMYLYSITPEFSKYISDINSNIGSNPMMGMPHNVSTNIYPQGKAVGFFEASSVISSSVIY